MSNPSRLFSIAFIDNLMLLRKKLMSRADTLIFWLSITLLFFSIAEIGFNLKPLHVYVLSRIYTYGFAILFILWLLRFATRFKWKRLSKRNISEIAILSLLFSMGLFRLWALYGASYPAVAMVFAKSYSAHVLVALVFIYEFSSRAFSVLERSFNPAMIFVLSFFFLIVVGALFLLLPNATTAGISVLDAFFTSTSAVCVTGLIVVDTATAFTPLGQWIILILIQLGGLGIMTFTSFFVLFFRGEATFQSQLFLKDVINEDNLGQILKSVYKIVLFTLGIELLGALFVYVSMGSDAEAGERLFVSIFHSVSAFCNAGFSTYTNGLYEPALRHNYSLQLVVVVLVIVGGLGFPILVNYYILVKHFIKNKINQLKGVESYYKHKPHVITAGTRLVLYTTGILLVVGTVVVFATEYNNTLKGLSWTGKLVTAFFGAVTPRTAGFNTINMEQLLHSTIFFTIFLMWVGASPGSTGGGIKTTTFALALLNAFSLARGKERVEFNRVQFSTESLRRAFAVMLLSTLVIGASVFMLSIFQPDYGLLNIVFEVVSAFSTVGLSLGGTSTLSIGGKIVIILTMFVGRVGMLTILIGLFKKTRYVSYKYPTENVYIT
ncbi:MAG: hypothetical protein JW783_08585 [Bacteroidales bacterium]|nr:hypothetical protein [Bacteroidales bacterium]MBN2748869.1 hypothetical protein [Bacteroidales bacterium]